MRTIRTIVAGLSLAGLSVMLGGFSPQKVECIAPSSPGGGWDFTCRTVGKLLHDLQLVPQPVQTTNITGASGAVAFANVNDSRRSDGNLLVATSTQSGVMLAQNKYPGTVDTVRWVATIGADVGVVFVGKDSPFRTLADLTATMKADPTSVSSGGGIYDYLRFLMIGQRAGLSTEELRKVRMIYYSGCGESIPAVMGGHIQVSVCDLSEAGGFIESGDIHVLAVLGEQRSAAPFDQLPTAREQGIDVVGYNWRGFYVGGDVSDEDYNGWVETLRKVNESPAWQETARAHGLLPLWKGGEEFETFVRGTVDEMTRLVKEIGIN